MLMALAVGNWWLCFQSPCQAAAQSPANLAERIRVLAAEDPGLLPVSDAGHFPQSILAEAFSAKLVLLSSSKVTSLTNAFFTESRQVLNLEATEPQLLHFLGKIAASNSPLRVQSLSLRPTPDQSRLRANMVMVADYRLPAPGSTPDSDAAQAEYLVLSRRRHLRQAALDCYNQTKSTLPPGWQLETFSFRDGKHVNMQGVAPADQVPLLEDVRAGLEKAKGQEGKDLVSSGQATMRMIEPGLTNFTWSMQFALQPPESR